MLQSLRSSKIKNFDVQICLRFRVDAVDNPRDTDDGRECSRYTTIKQR